MTSSTRKRILTLFAIALVGAALVGGVQKLLTGLSDPSPRFDIKQATRNGFVHLTAEGHRFKIPLKYVSGVTTWQNGSVATVNVRLVLPELEPYDPNNKRHSYEFSPYVGGGWRNQLNLRVGGRQSVPLDELFRLSVTSRSKASLEIRVTPRLPESDDPEGVEIYSSPNKKEPPQQYGPVGWSSGQDHFVIRDGSHTTFYARCDRQVPDQSPGCNVYADFGPDINAEYTYGRPTSSATGNTSTNTSPG